MLILVFNCGSSSLKYKLLDMPAEVVVAGGEAQRVGPKTAAIVLCFSLGKPAFPVDTHIYRVSGRTGLRHEKMTVEQAHPYLESLFPPETYYAAHLNLIRLGREICNARKPLCPKCPIIKLCDYKNKTK